MVACSGAMANPEHLAILKQGVEVWNRWAKGNRGSVDLARGDLSEMHLAGVDFTDVDLSEVRLYKADLFSADLYRANMRGATLLQTNFTQASLHRTDLSQAFLVGANFAHASLRKATLRGATFGDTILANTDLTGAAGLDECVHQGPSILEHRTLAKSGPLPEPFLRGCGLPNALIQYIPSLFETRIRFYSVFISYSTTDEDFVSRLYSELQAGGVRCWFAPHDIQGGKKIHKKFRA